ncbi:MAG: sugar phosphate isomerase/epimerase [Limnochordaceae bacterium]|nr:sugar phosphate isomerase/epimerase [Limnochordaceae bacterium]
MTVVKEVGVQSYTYRKFPVRQVADQLKAIGAQAAEVWDGHLPAETADDEVQSVLEHFRKQGVRICGYGVVWLGSPAVVQKVLPFAKRLGVDYVSIDVNPNDEATQEEAVRLAQELGLRLAIHNHGPGHAYSTPDKVQAVVSRYPEVLGACIDTGHYLRSNVDPLEAVRSLGSRVYAVHLKDFIDEKTEVQPGKGRLDLPAVVSALKQLHFASAYVIEYEADPADPSPAVQPVVAQVKALL